MSGLVTLLELVRMRLLLLLRAPEVLFWAFVFPILLSLVLGLAFRDRTVAPARVAVLAGEGAAEVVALLEEVERVEPVLVHGDQDALRRLRSGAVDLVVGRTDAEPSYEFRHDPTRQEGERAQLLVDAALQRAAGREDSVEVSVSPTTETGSRFVDWFLPGLLALSVMSTSVWAVGFAFVEARQRRLTKRFLVTPVGRASYLFAHVLARLVLLVLEVGVLLAFAHYVLDVPFRGSFTAFFVLALIGALCFSSIGILLGSRAKTMEGAAGLINLTMMPMGLASGVFFSYERFSESLQPLIRALPLTPFVDSLRAVMLEGQGLSELTGQIALQLVWGAAAFALGMALFRWK